MTDEEMRVLRAERDDARLACVRLASRAANAEHDLRHVETERDALRAKVRRVEELAADLFRVAIAGEGITATVYRQNGDRILNALNGEQT